MLLGSRALPVATTSKRLAAKRAGDQSNHRRGLDNFDRALKSNKQRLAIYALRSVRRESLQKKKNLLCLLTLVRGQKHWCLGEALRSDSATDSWHQGRTIFASALTERILLYLFFIRSGE
jgi:hypothetical protein